MCVLVGAALCQGVPFNHFWLCQCSEYFGCLLAQPLWDNLYYVWLTIKYILPATASLHCQTWMTSCKHTCLTQSTHFDSWLPRCIVKVGRRPTRPQLVPMNIPLSLSQATCSSHHYTIYISHIIHTQYTHHVQCICMDSGYCKLRRMKVVFIIVTGCDTKASRTF